MLNWRAAGISDKGCQRKVNEDCFFVSWDKRLFVVCDGMGGAEGGQLASQLAQEEVGRWYSFFSNSNEQSSLDNWQAKAIAAANREIFVRGEENHSLRGMGSTIVLAWQSTNNEIDIAYVGDSRAYLYSQTKEQVPKLIQLTEDHTVPMGGPTSSPYRNLITNCLGHQEEIGVIDEAHIEVTEGDWLLLCTDGLTTVLQDEEITSVIQKAREPQAACEELTRLTLNGGAPDNVTLIAVQYY